MTEKKYIENAYNMFKQVYQLFKNDPDFEGNFHFEWVNQVTDIAFREMISDRIQAQRNTAYNNKDYNKQYNNKQKNNNNTVQQNMGDGSATDKQKKAVFAITHYKDKQSGKWLPNKKFELLPCKIEKLSFEHASSFIEEHGGN
jgi:hypothetical protein